MRVLVIEDDDAVRAAVRRALLIGGYEVLQAETGEDGLLRAQTDVPDAIVLDLGLPDMDGVDVIGGLRGWTAVPIIVLSGRADSTDKVEALDAGADMIGFVFFPKSPRHVDWATARALGRQARGRAKIVARRKVTWSR